MAATRPRTSQKTALFTESVIREMTRLALQHSAVNLSQGFPDFPAPEFIKEAARAAIQANSNQYSVTWGAKPLRDAIAADLTRRYGRPIDPDTQVTVCCGATETMIATLLAIVDPGDEIVVFEPFYENYGPDAILSGAVPRYVPLHPPRARHEDWWFDADDLARAFSNRTRAVIINTPNNPTGKVFTRAELTAIAAECQKWGAIAITDEIYEHIVFDDVEHVPMAMIDGMADRTVTINSTSKTFSVTGWRVGWAVAPPDIAPAIRKVHDFLTVGAATPLQAAAAAALNTGSTYFPELRAGYQARRDRMLGILDGAGFEPFVPRGAYYVMAGIHAFGFADDRAFADYLVADVGVACVPASSFFRPQSAVKNLVRFCFCKSAETLTAAEDRFARGLRPAAIPQALSRKS
jgi:aminotransferase